MCVGGLSGCTTIVLCGSQPRALLCWQIRTTPHTTTSMPRLGITALRITTGAVVVARGMMGTQYGYPPSIPVLLPQQEERGGPWIIRPLLSHRKNWVCICICLYTRTGTVYAAVTQYVNNLAKLVPVSPMEELPHGRTCEAALSVGVPTRELLQFFDPADSRPRGEAKQNLGGTCVRPLRHYSHYHHQQGLVSLWNH